VRGLQILAPREAPEKNGAQLQALERELAVREAAKAARAALLQRLMSIELKPPERTQSIALTPELAQKWQASIAFLRERAAALRAELRADESALEDLRSRHARLEEASKGGRASRSVVAQLSGRGRASLELRYFIQSARWQPRYELAWNTERDELRLALAGQVSQASGEEWRDALLTLSTAFPARTAQLPDLPSWRIGPSDLFVPTSRVSSDQGPAFVQSPSLDASASIAGNVVDATNQQPVKDAVIIATSPALPGEQTAVTGVRGEFLLGLLPAGSYMLTVQREGYQPFSQSGLAIQSGRGIKVRLQIIPDSFRGEQVVIAAQRPTISTMSTTTGGTIGREQMNLLPGGLPGGGVGPPGAFEGPSKYGIDLRRSGSPESNFIADGLNVSNPAIGLQGATNHAEFAAQLDGGFALSFAALAPADVRSGGEPQPVALLAETWQIDPERVLYPALSDEAYLVATLKSPSKITLPAGVARLSVDGDPAGVAQLPLVAPGEQLTLALGRDRAVKSARNVRALTGTRGLFGKRDVTEYAVTIEVANPHRRPIALRVVDQWPLPGRDEVESDLLTVEPAPLKKDAEKGALEWRLALKPGEKRELRFSYSLKRPQGWELAQGGAR
jgi:hypothetical protein